MNFRIRINLPLFVLFASAILSSAGGCRQAGPSPDAGKVVVSIFPVYDIARAIAGERLGVSYVVPPGANPHVYEPNPSTIATLKTASIFIGIAPGYDGWAARIVPSTARLHYLTDPARDANPHIWLTPKGARRIAERIADVFSEYDPKGAAAYRDNLDSYRRRLDAAHDSLAARFRTIKSRSFIQWHPAWDYLAAEYGITIAGTIETGHGDKASVRHFKRLVDAARAASVRVIAIDLNVQGTEADILAGEIGGSTVRLDTIGDPLSRERSSLIALMLDNAERLAGALNR